VAFPECILKLSAGTVAMLKTHITQNKLGLEDRVFPTDSATLSENFRRLRNNTAEKLHEPAFKTIRLYDFRHWKATTEYLRTRDIFHVKELLGHKRIENTLRYVHVASAVTTDETRYVCKVAHSVAEAQSLIEDSWEYVTEMDGVKLFRKPK
jgi:site-specific recombinase XerD